MPLQKELPALPDVLVSAVVTCLMEARSLGLAQHPLASQPPGLPEGLAKGTFTPPTAQWCAGACPPSQCTPTCRVWVWASQRGSPAAPSPRPSPSGAPAHAHPLNMPMMRKQSACFGSTPYHWIPSGTICAHPSVPNSSTASTGLQSRHVCYRVNENGGRLWHAELVTSIQKHEEARANLRMYAARLTDALKQAR